MLASGENCRGANGESFICNIPDEIVFEILRFLPIKDIARINLVSKRLRQLCLSIPDLFLDFELYTIKKIGNWIDRFLTLHNGAKLRRVFLKMNSFLNHEEDIHRVCEWIHNITVICKAEELYLSFGMSMSTGWSREEGCFLLPLSTFLRAIKLRLDNTILKLPSSTGNSFSSLQDLDIEDVRLDPSNLSKDWVSTLFPAIKKLNLEKVRGIYSLNITSSSLKWLSINPCGIQVVVVSAERLQTLCIGACYPCSHSLFRIYAPSLQKIWWRLDDYWFPKFPKRGCMCLQSVTFGANENMLVLLQFINHAKSVTLLGAILEELYTQDLLRYILDNVQNLNLEVACKKDHKIPALASFFGRLPNLKTLTMRCVDDDKIRLLFNIFSLLLFYIRANNELALETPDFDIEYWESQYVAFIHQLKVAKIEIQIYCYEVGLIKYLIKHAKALDSMTVTFSIDVNIGRSKWIREKLSEFYESFPDSTLDFMLK